jgi:hypothetical protein
MLFIFESMRRATPRRKLLNLDGLLQEQKLGT